MKKLVLIGLVAVLSVSIVTGVVLAKSNFVHAPVFGACANDVTGLLVKFATHQADCADNQTFVTWNQVGPQGPIGPVGPQGPTGDTGPQGAPGVSSYQIVTTGFHDKAPGAVVEAFCPKGKVTLGGGVDLSSTGHVELLLSAPAGNGKGWKGAFTDDNGKHADIRVWAICAVVA